MAAPGYRIDSLAKSFPDLKKGDRDFFITVIQDKLRKIFSAHEKNTQKRSNLIAIAQEDIIQALSQSSTPIKGSFSDWIKTYISSKMQKYKHTAESIQPAVVESAAHINPTIADTTGKTEMVSSVSSSFSLTEEQSIIHTTTNNYFSERPYQTQGIAMLYKHALKTLRHTPITESKKLETAALLDAATGSGKSYIIGETINRIFELRERMKGLGYGEVPLRILVLSDRIKTLHQARGAYVDGYTRGDKTIPAAFSEGFRSNLTTHEFHSSVETQPTGIIDTSGDSITFSTFQTAGEKNIGSEFNIILVAEGHHLPAESFFTAFEKYYVPLTINDTVYHPLVITDTATADGALLDLTGNPVFSYPIYEYLASERAPEVTYHVIACQSIEQKDISVMQQIVKDIAAIKDPVHKHKQMLELKRTLNTHLAKFPDERSMVDDFLDRAGEELGPTLIVCKDIKEAERVRNIFAQKLPSDKKVMSYHSGNDDEGGFELFSNNEIDVLVTVDMCIEAIDMPEVEHIVLRRNMRSRKQYMQVLGRGMRGNYITYRDYVGGYANFSRINDLYRKTEEEKDKLTNKSKSKKFSLLQEGIINVESKSHELAILELMRDLQEIEDGLQYKHAQATDIFDMYDQGLIHLKDVTPQKRTRFAKERNKKYGMEKHTLPMTLNGLIGLLGGDTDYTSSLRYAQALLKREDFVLKPRATKDNLQKLRTDGTLTKEILSKNNYGKRAEEQNRSDAFSFEIPSSLHGLHTTLYRYQRNPVMSVDYLVSLLGNTEFIPEKVATREQILQRAQTKEEGSDEYLIPSSVITTNTYNTFAKQWNESKGETLGKLPHTIKTLANRLNVIEQIPYIRAALEGNIMVENKPFANAEQLRSLRNKSIIKSEVLSNDKRHTFVTKRNEKAQEKDNKEEFLLPRTMRGLFTTLGGTGESVTRAHTIALFNQTSYTPPPPLINKQTLIEMYNSGEIPEENTQAERRREFAGARNDKKSKDVGYTLPLDIKSLISQLGGDYRYDSGKEYTRSLFKQEHYIRRPWATQEQIQSMVEKNMLTASVCNHQHRNEFANSRNEEYSILRLCRLPTQFGSFAKMVLQDECTDFSPDNVKRCLFNISEIEVESKDDEEVLTAPPKKDVLLTLRQKQKLDLKDRIKVIKLKAKEFRDDQEYAKAYALYYHVRTLDHTDLLSKTRISKIKEMNIEISKQATIIALREIPL